MTATQKKMTAVRQKNKQGEDRLTRRQNKFAVTARMPESEKVLPLR